MGRASRDRGGTRPSAAPLTVRLPRRRQWDRSCLRHSLLVRLLAVSALVSLCSVTATAWVVVRTTTVAIDKERGLAADEDARVYDALLGYAATHTSWDNAGQLVEDLADSTGQRILLTDPEGHAVRDSATTPGRALRPPERPLTTVDPLKVDSQLTPDAVNEAIDPRAIGPFRLTTWEKRRLHQAAVDVVECFRTVLGVPAEVGAGPNGRPRLVTRDPDSTTSPRCNSAALGTPLPTERKALQALNNLVNACLSQQETGTVRLALNLSWQPATEFQETDSVKVDNCLTSSRRQQLAPYVAPAVQLYVGGDERLPTAFFDLSAGNRLRIAGAASLVLLLTVAITTLVGIRLIKPLRALTSAAQSLGESSASPRVNVAGNDEIAQLSAAFNAMSARQAELESLRKNMTSDIAHELRTPLSNIRGWLEAVADGIAQPDTDLVASLLSQAFLLQHIIDDLRDLSAADAGELRLSKQPVEVTDLIEATVTAHQAGAQAAGVRLTAAIAADSQSLPVLDADPVRLRQVFGNLASNAIRHTPRGGTVTFDARCDHGDVVIDVADTGSGIAPEELPHVFERFWRAEKSRSRQGGGSGLGLAIVRKLTEAHGGTVTAISTVGKGSVFTLRLPTAQEVDRR